MLLQLERLSLRGKVSHPTMDRKLPRLPRLPWLALVWVTVATLLLVACGGTSTAPTQPSPTATAQPSPSPAPTQAIRPVAIANVKIIEKDGKYSFDPATLTVKVRTQVIWTNSSNAPHTVTSTTGDFNTPNILEQKQTFMVVFTKPGTYIYYCNIHLYMQGSIVVQP